MSAEGCIGSWITPEVPTQAAKDIQGEAWCEIRFLRFACIARVWL